MKRSTTWRTPWGVHWLGLLGDPEVAPTWQPARTRRNEPLAMISARRLPIAETTRHRAIPLRGESSPRTLWSPGFTHALNAEYGHSLADMSSVGRPSADPDNLEDDHRTRLLTIDLKRVAAWSVNTDLGRQVCPSTLGRDLPLQTTSGMSLNPNPIRFEPSLRPSICLPRIRTCPLISGFAIQRTFEDAQPFLDWDWLYLRAPPCISPINA